MRRGFFCLASLVCLMLLLSPGFSGAARPTVGSVGSPSGWKAHPDHIVVGPASSTPTGLTTSQIRHAYGFDQLGCYGAGNCGSGQVVAIVDAYDDPSAESDLGVFSSQFGLPPCTTANGCFTKATPGGQPTTDLGWAEEISLDIQWAHAIAPSAKILLVEAKTGSLGDMLTAIDYASAQPGVHQVSMSFGLGGEFSNDTAYDTHFQVSGVSFLAASGDCGWSTGGFYCDPGADIEWPAVSPYVVGVGGTVLNVTAQGNVQSEVAWTYSSGGLSAYVTKPSYQVGFQSYGMRGIPDVSYNAGTGVSVYDSLDSGWISLRGTSAGSPQWAALTAIVNSERSVPLSSGPGGADIALYTAATGSNYGPDYRDITSGSNGNGYKCGNLCRALAGYDFVTGLGSPKANSLVPFLAGLSLPTSYSVTFSESGLASGTSWSVVTGGNVYTGTSSQIVVSGVSQFEITYSVPIVNCNSGCRYTPSPSSGNVEVALQTSVGIVFTPWYYLTVTEVNQGLGACGALSPVSGWYQGGSTVPLTAKWATGCTWYGWAGSGPGSFTGKGTITGSPTAGYTATASITMNGVISETGTFYCKSFCQV